MLEFANNTAQTVPAMVAVGMTSPLMNAPSVQEYGDLAPITEVLRK